MFLKFFNLRKLRINIKRTKNQVDVTLMRNICYTQSHGRQKNVKTFVETSFSFNCHKIETRGCMCCAKAYPFPTLNQ